MIHQFKEAFGWILTTVTNEKGINGDKKKKSKLVWLVGYQCWHLLQSCCKLFSEMYLQFRCELPYKMLKDSSSRDEISHACKIQSSEILFMSKLFMFCTVSDNQVFMSDFKRQVIVPSRCHLYLQIAFWLAGASSA